MTYSLEFKKDALKEWESLPLPIKDIFKKKLRKLMENPHIPAARLSGFGAECFYKIKLRSSGYRLVYKAEDEYHVIIIIAVGKRDKSAVYRAAHKRG